MAVSVAVEGAVPVAVSGGVVATGSAGGDGRPGAVLVYAILRVPVSHGPS